MSTTANSSPPSRTSRSEFRSDVDEPLAQLLEELVAGRVTEGVVDLLEVVEVDEQEGKVAIRRHASPIGEERVEDPEQVATVAETGQVVGHRLAVALLAQLLQAPDRQHEPDADHEQCRRRQPDRDPADRAQRADEQDDERGGGAELGKQEPGRLLGSERVRRPLAQPDRHRHDDDRRRPGDPVEDDADVRRSDRVREQVERVADDVQADARRKQDPGPSSSSGEQRRASDDEAEQQQVPDRVGEVRHRRHAGCRPSTTRIGGRRTPRTPPPRRRRRWRRPASWGPRACAAPAA